MRQSKKKKEKLIDLLGRWSVAGNLRKKFAGYGKNKTTHTQKKTLQNQSVSLGESSRKIKQRKQ